MTQGSRKFYDKNYSPLVINLKTKAGAKLLGLDAGVKFLGQRFTRKKQFLYEEYDNMELRLIRDEVNNNMGVLRAVISHAYVRTGWIDGTQGDALLVRDLNLNGKIDSGFELFGEATLVNQKALTYDPAVADWGDQDIEDFAHNGFVALHQYDSNNDLVIDDKDKITVNDEEVSFLSTLHLWQDGRNCMTYSSYTSNVETGKISGEATVPGWIAHINTIGTENLTTAGDACSDYNSEECKAALDGKCTGLNGMTEPNELLTLDEAKITSFDLQTIVQMQERDIHNNRTLLRSTFKFKDEDNKTQMGMVYDVYFTKQDLSQKDRNSVPTLTDEERTRMIDLSQLL